jgi:hypothetical protein
MKSSKATAPATAHVIVTATVTATVELSFSSALRSFDLRNKLTSADSSSFIVNLKIVGFDFLILHKDFLIYNNNNNNK